MHCCSCFHLHCDLCVCFPPSHFLGLRLQRKKQDPTGSVYRLKTLFRHRKTSSRLPRRPGTTTTHHQLEGNRSIAFINYSRPLSHPIHLHSETLFSIDIGRRKPHDSPRVLCVSVYLPVPSAYTYFMCLRGVLSSYPLSPAHLRCFGHAPAHSSPSGQRKN